MVPSDDIVPGFRGNRPRLRGDTNLKPRAASEVDAPSKPVEQGPPVASGKKQVLFICIGNSCRSQMAEALAKAYGSDILIAKSAGLSPASTIAPLTKKMLAERNVNMDGHFPKGLDAVVCEPYDVVINISGYPINMPNSRIVTWTVRDPIGQPEAVYQSVVQQIEGLVMGLILTLRNGRLP